MAGVGAAATPQGAPLPRLCPALSSQVTVSDGEAFVSFTPDSRPRLSAGIDFSHLAPVIGRQWATWSPLDDDHFYLSVAPARTFTIDVAHADLVRRGFCKGGSLENALVASERFYINGPERLASEPARHKLLDLIGDLSLLVRYILVLCDCFCGLLPPALASLAGGALGGGRPAVQRCVA